MMKINKLIMGCAVLFLSGGLGLGAQAPDPSLGMVAQKKEIENLIADKDVTSVLADKAWGSRDPFDLSVLTPPAPKVESKGQEKKPVKIKPNYVLQGIFLGSSKPSVIINGTVVGVGNVVQGAMVKEIKGDRVVLTDDEGKQKILSLNP
jgi:type II secretory pathway component PulC